MAWPVRFSRVYRFRPGEVGQITLEWEGIKARHFDLRLDALVPFEATLTRSRDGSILFHHCCDARAQAVIPWGRDESAYLAIQSHGSLGGQSSPDGIASIDDRERGGLEFTLSLAIDPHEEGLEVYRFQVNRFLDLYREGEFDRARYALALALQEDPHDSTAVLLSRRLQEEQAGLSRSARTRRLMEEAIVAMSAADYATAVLSYQMALQLARDAAARFDAYHGLTKANYALGNDKQAELAIEAAIRETTDEAGRKEAASWRRAKTPE